jgi:hypothetical protein
MGGVHFIQSPKIAVSRQPSTESRDGARQIIPNRGEGKAMAPGTGITCSRSPIQATEHAASSSAALKTGDDQARWS